MGMAASQGRIFFLMSRESDCKFSLIRYANQKEALARDMSKVTNEYQEALNAKKYQWSAGNSSYVDMSYSLLMSPSAMNGNTPYMITDSSDRVVVDTKYKQYAEMISADGTPGDWDECKYEVLSQILGVSEQDLTNYDGYYLAFLDNKQNLADIEELEPINRNSFTVQDSNSVKKLLTKMGSANGISNWASAYVNPNKKISKSDIPSVMEKIKESLSKYFMEGADKFAAACDSVAQWSAEDDVTVKDLIDRLMGNYAGLGGAFASQAYADANGDTYPVWYDVDSTAYTTYMQSYNQWEALKNEAETAMKTSLDAYNQLFSADQEAKIEFYDNLFSAIAEKGWRCYEDVSDSNYLNQMLQNNQFYITTVDRELTHKSNGEYSYENSYDTDIASNYTKLTQVTDSDIKDDALVKYEQAKKLINAKESRIDTRMKKLETEQAAIQAMIDSIQKVMNNNMEQHLNIFNS